MAAVTSRKSLSLFLKDLEHSFDKFLCIFNVEFVSEPDRMFVTHPISLLVFKLIFLHRGFSCTSWSHPRNVTVVGYALTAHWCPEKWQNSRHCLSLGEKHLKHGRKAEFLWSHQQHLRETCMPQVLTLFFNFFFFWVATTYLILGEKAGHGSEVKCERSDMGKTSCPWGQFVCVSGKYIIPAPCPPLSLKEQAVSEYKWKIRFNNLSKI